MGYNSSDLVNSTRDNVSCGEDSKTNAQPDEDTKPEPTREEFFEKCREIATASDILGRFEEQLQRCGLAGERRYAKLLYLVLHTRFFDQPVSAVIKGPSSGGKSHLLKTVLRFVPEFAFEALTGMSDKFLAYWKTDLRHRFLVIYEAAGLRDGPGRTFLRTLLSEGHLKYATLGQTKEGYEPIELYREGPTGLLMTTTSTGLHPEDESRLLSITVDDTPAQIRFVLEVMAETVTGDVDLDDWHAFHAWLGLGDHKVVIPFSVNLARQTKPAHNRIKRDFGHVLNLIRAHALIHQENRERDDQGSVIATLDDYAVVRDLVERIVSSGVAATVTPEIRETIEAVKNLTDLTEITPEKILSMIIDKIPNSDGLPLGQIAEKLGLDKASTSRRVKTAIELGYLHNQENHRGKPAKVVLGELLPEDFSVLPTLEELQAAGTSPE